MTAFRMLFLVAGLALLALAIRQMKTGIAMTISGAGFGPVRKSTDPLLYWYAVLGNLIAGILFTAGTFFFHGE